ncbi:MAG: serine hydrolase domain-containing protein [Gemmatimonadales bacterium]
MNRIPAWLAASLVLGACAGGAAGTGTGAGSGAAATGDGVTGSGSSSAVIAAVDSIVQAPIRDGKLIGGSVAVVRGDDTLALRRFGYADAELGTPTPPHAVYEIGSVTKQFTGVAIMQLVERGKVDLDADVTTYLPNLPMKGRKVSVRHLLDHTSGIKGYTEMPSARPLFHRAVPKDSIVQMFMAEKWDFEPGEEEIYNNSAFFLAGMVIEKASGMSYEDYLEENLFKPAGMHDSHYCSETKIMKGKVKGYDSDSAGPILRGPISHAWPYAAGSICSSTTDLVAWNNALHRDGKLLGPEAYAEFIRPSTLADGTTLGYSKGIAVYDRLGKKALHHGGGINGFLSENIYFPEESLSVVVLYNTAGPASPDAAAEAIAEAVLGKSEQPAVAFDGDASALAGTFVGNGRGQAMKFDVLVDGSSVAIKGPATRDSAVALTYRGNGTFTRDYVKYTFLDGGKKLRVDAGYGNTLLTRQ